MRAPRVVLFALSLSLAGYTATALADTPVDDFESPGAVGQWSFTNGAEFPGATGSTASTSGHAGNGLEIAYDFTGGGNYVGASRMLSATTPAAALAFWARTPPGSRLTVRVSDGTDQTGHSEKD